MAEGAVDQQTDGLILVEVAARAVVARVARGKALL
jgi:hypothetical protein